MDGPTEFGRRGVSGKGSCPADRQAASWWSHLATQSQPEVMGPSLHLQCTVAPRPSQKASGMVVGDGAPSWRVKPSAKSSLSLLLLCARFAYSTAAFLTFFSLFFPCVTFHSSPSSTYVDGNQPTWGGRGEGRKLPRRSWPTQVLRLQSFIHLYSFFPLQDSDFPECLSAMQRWAVCRGEHWGIF